MVKIRTYYDRDTVSFPGEYFEEKSLCQQHFACECDINNIMDKYSHTGVLPQIPGAEFLDVVDAPSYHDAWQLIVSAEERFESLPAKFVNVLTMTHLNIWNSLIIQTTETKPSNLASSNLGRSCGLGPAFT